MPKVHVSDINVLTNFVGDMETAKAFYIEHLEFAVEP